MGYFHPEDPTALAFAARIGDQLLPTFRGCSLAIVGVGKTAIRQHGSLCIVEGDRIVTQMGTGTLFRVADEHFLVTAWHVFEGIERRGEDPLVWSGDPPVLTPLIGTLYSTGKAVDIAIFHLDPALVAGLVGKRFLRLSDVEFRRDLGNGWYFLHGYPFCDSHPSKDLLTTLQGEFTYGAGLYAGKTTGFGSYRPEFHILLAYDGESRHADDGSPAELPRSLGGISGSSVWLGFSERHVMDDWTPMLAKVVGVQTMVYSDKKVAQATRWAGVAVVIWKNFLPLRDQLRPHLPAELLEDLKCR